MGGGSTGGQSRTEGVEKVESSQEKRVPPPQEKEAARCGEESLADIEARWAAAYRAGKENTGIWPACPDGSM